ncbi:hypothetical protein IFM89_001955 [Coptis chinensis]|uniref:FAD-binding FR-type domain-containing protein n=1 Tax=Coptis chinensis TaxID=261450 RepID=A0A835HSX7_9MAGN|nr:hypothetical protein IFM89_001955 [Coptis chinensis]
MAMDGVLEQHQVPLLSNVCYDASTKKTTAPPPPPPHLSLPLFFLKWALKILMWVITIAWVAFVFFYPSEFVQRLYTQWIRHSSGTLFGRTGSAFLITGGPVLIVVFLAIGYVIASSPENFHDNRFILPITRKKPKFKGFRLWTFPILVDGPFGIVNAAELIGILLFAVYIIWAVSAYTLQNLNILSKFTLLSWEKSSLMLALMGSRFGTIGLFCLAFLFLPVARGSFLLRLIDVPFEQATRYHVWLGHLTMLMFTLHGVFFLWGWAMQGRLLREMLRWPNIGIAILPGVISLFSGLLMWVTSLHPVRTNYFELFFYTHQLYVIFVIFLAFHVGDFIFSIASAGIFLFILDRFLRFCQSRKTVKVVSATCLPCGTLELVFSKPASLQYNALSFIFLQVRELSWLQWHAFSVSSSPLDGRHHISVLIKVLGEWTRNLGARVSLTPEDSLKERLLHHYRITASVEGPYGHESSYHLKYKNLILVAGGIGISPFLAILRDIVHHLAQKAPCMTEKVSIVWAVKRSNELSLLYSLDFESICPCYADKLHLEIQTYVTRESEPALEDGKVCKRMNCSYFPDVDNSGISGLVGTGNKVLSGLYVIFSTIGFIALLSLVDLFYIKPCGISTGWFSGLLFVTCMVGSVVTFGAIMVVLWHLWERRDSSYERCMKDGKHEEVQCIEPIMSTAGNPTTLGSLSSIQYGCRPNLRGRFLNELSPLSTNNSFFWHS